MPQLPAPPLRLLTCLVVCAALLNTPKGLAQTWREVQSPHFRVLTDGSDGDGRTVAKEFEQMRSIFADRFPHATLDTGAPLLIVAVDATGLHALAPALWKDRKRIAGEFLQGWERKYALVRLDSIGDYDQAVVFHEYTHTILHANLHWLPTWLDEGLAEFYGYTRFQGDHIYLGAPSPRLGHLQNDTFIPMSDMLTATPRTFFKDESKEDLFYAEAWAIVHYMTFAPEMGQGAKLHNFIALLENGTPQLQAFQQVFGDPNTFQKKLSNYVSKLSITVGLLPPPQKIDAKSFPARVLTVAEADYDLGSFDIGAHDSAAGKALLQAAEAADPSLAGPHEELGFLAWRQGHDQEARTEWQKAVSADPSCYRAAFALLMSGTSLKNENQQQLEQTQQALEAIKQTAPMFAPVVVELAMIQWRLGHLQQAYNSSLAAEKLEPWRAEYHLLTGYILLQGHQPKAAENAARTVAARWPGSDHNEAVDLWNQLPANLREDGPPLQFSFPADTTVVRGTIISSSCDKGPLNLVLQPLAENASAIKFVTTGPFESGFSDTLWVGEDHYTPCFHVAGLPAVVAYKATGTEAKNLRVLEVRDDLPLLNPPLPSPKPPQATTTPQPNP